MRSRIVRLFLSVAALLIAPQAMADWRARPADYVVYQAAPPFSWGGAYVGVHGGLSFASGMPNPFDDANGFNLGVQAGYNFQLGPGVLGFEVEGSSLGGAEQDVLGGRLEEAWRVAAKARAGLSFDRMLVFGTLGYTLTEFDAGGGASGGGWKAGYLWGAGVEQGFGGGLSAKIEYDYVFTPDVETMSIYGPSNSDIGSHVLKAGLNFRF